MVFRTQRYSISGCTSRHGLLRAGTHGRGLWERKLDVASLPAVDLFVRDHLMSSARLLPTPEAVPAAFEDLLQYVHLGDPQYHWMCADIKVDALEGTPPAYQMDVAAVDYLAFETALQHRNAQRGNVNRVYVQLHNRGYAAAADVTVKLLYADASAGLPPLPSDFWTAYPNDPAITAVWHPIGSAKVVTSLRPGIPAVVEWDWAPPLNAAQHSCLLAVIDSASDSIPAGAKIFDVDALVKQEKRVGLKNLHVVDAAPGTTVWRTIDVWSTRADRPRGIRLLASTAGAIGIVLPKPSGAALRIQVEGLTARKPAAAVLTALKKQFPERAAKLNLTQMYSIPATARTGRAVVTARAASVGALVCFSAKTDAVFSVVQEDGAEIVGGSTFALRMRAGRRLGQRRNRNRNQNPSRNPSPSRSLSRSRSRSPSPSPVPR